MELTDLQLATLTALCDTLIAEVSPAPDNDVFWKQTASDLNVPTVVAAVLEKAPAATHQRVERILNQLNEDTGVRFQIQRFAALSSQQKESILQEWKKSDEPSRRADFRYISSMVLRLFYIGLPPNPENAIWKRLGFLNVREVSPSASLASRLQITSLADQRSQLECDVVVVGSGAGGSVVACELAKRGYSVIVLEKGPYVSRENISRIGSEIYSKIYDGRGVLPTEDESVFAFAGSCLGGGTFVNWAGALRAPDWVLEEWASNHANPHFNPSDFKKYYEYVEAATEVNLDPLPLGKKDEKLAEGARALGYKIERYPRNAKNCDGEVCGVCDTGCAIGAKRDTVTTFLSEASKNGARILVETEVQKVLVQSGRAIGVEAIHRSTDGKVYQASIRAKKVVLAGGSIHTPALLLRSGLQHDEIGRNLSLHPTGRVFAAYGEPMLGWHGPIMPIFCSEFDKLEGGHGFRIITGVHRPRTFTQIDWKSGADHKSKIAMSDRTVAFCPIVQDDGAGRVDIDHQGAVRLNYWLSPTTQKLFARGIVESARLHFAAGAKQIWLPNGVDFNCSAGTEKLNDALRELQNWTWDRHRFTVLSAHQMGTCRMGGDRARHPVKTNGETVEVDGLFVADASLFPSSSGANPNLTVQAIARFVSDQISI